MPSGCREKVSRTVSRAWRHRTARSATMRRRPKHFPDVLRAADGAAVRQRPEAFADGGGSISPWAPALRANLLDRERHDRERHERTHLDCQHLARQYASASTASSSIASAATDRT